jgi:penicillin-binding protein 1A
MHVARRTLIPTFPIPDVPAEGYGGSSLEATQQLRATESHQAWHPRRIPAKVANMEAREGSGVVSHAARGLFTKAALATEARALFRAVLLAGVVSFAIYLLVGVIVRSDRWDLPNGRLLQTVLSSCQIEHERHQDVDTEHMICPTRVPARDFPQVLQDAIIASEDSRFFAHGALDPRATARASWQLFRGNRQGGSTITQQLARSLLLKKEDSFGRKLSEAVLAMRIYAVLSREEILARYMNVVPHARNMSGFDDPGRYYFGVRAQDLNLGEAALLVGMLPEPNNRDPLKAPEKAFEGAVRVLKQMVAHGKITAKQATDAAAELERRLKNGTLRRGDKSYRRIEYRPYRDLALREAKANGIDLGDDYRIVLFLDPGLQRTLTAQICAITGTHQAAGFFMRPSGEVLALSGSCAYTGEWNRATDITRSIGSTGKLFPLIAVQEAGISLESRLSTQPVRKPNWPAEPSSLCLRRQTVSLDFALAQSCNRPWTEMSLQLGDKVNDIVKRFGLTPPDSPAIIPIGGLHTSPMKLAQAYGALGNDGLLPQIKFLAAAIGPRGSVIGRPPERPKSRVMSSATAAAVLQSLRGPVKRGTARRANSPHALVYGKTGTSSYNEDALFVGLTQDFVGVFWLGYDWPKPMPGVHGGGRPAKAFSNLTNFYYVRLAQQRFAEEHAVTRAWEKMHKLPLTMFVAFASLLMTSVALLAVSAPRPRPDEARPDDSEEDSDLQEAPPPPSP